MSDKNIQERHFTCTVTRSGVQLTTHALASSLGVVVGVLATLFLLHNEALVLPQQTGSAQCAVSKCAPVECKFTCPTRESHPVSGNIDYDAGMHALVALGHGQLYSAPWKSRAPFDLPAWIDKAKSPPFVVLHPVLTPHHCNKLVEEIPKLITRRIGLFGNNTGEADNQNEVLSADHYVLRKHHDKFSWLFKQILKTINTANDNAWKKSIPRDFRSDLMEPLLFAGYNATVGGRYNWHTDVGGEGQHARRVLSAVMLLSDPGKDFTGGDFQVFYALKETTLTLKQGSMVIFPSSMLHRLKPVLEGFRMSLVVQIISPAL